MKRLKSNKKLYILLLCITFLITCIGSITKAQSRFVETQYAINPWVYNPAKVADKPFTQLGISYRQQWLGIQGALSRLRLDLQGNVGKNFRLGGMVQQISEGPFQEVEAILVPAYLLKLGKENYAINFGLSLGIGNRMVNMSKFSDPNDPGLIGLPNAKTYVMGGFGIDIILNNLEIGAAIPHFIRDERTSTQNFVSPSIDSLNYFLATIGYHFKIQGSTTISPEIIYHFDNGFESSQFEILTTITYNQKIWGGISYRQVYGGSLLAGINLRKYFDISYIFTIPSLGAITNRPSHEILFRWHLGKERLSKREKRMRGDPGKYFFYR